MPLISGKELLLFVNHGSCIFHLVDYSATPPQRHIFSQWYIPPPSHCFCHFTHLYPLYPCLSVWLFTPWKCQLNGAGLVSSVSSRALVRMQGCVFMCMPVCIIWPLRFHTNRLLSVKPGDLSCPGISIHLTSPVRSGHMVMKGQLDLTELFARKLKTEVAHI